MLLGNGFLALFSAALVFAAGGCFFWYLIALRLSRSGFQINFFGGPRSTISMFREYRHSASLKGWPKWPVAAFWICGIGMFLTGVGSVLAAQAESTPSFVASWSKSTIVYRWVALSSLCCAIVFSYRVFVKTSGQRSRVNEKDQLQRSNALRGDFYLMVLAWLGFLASVSILLLNQIGRRS
jgi:hypothetical protein